MTEDNVLPRNPDVRLHNRITMTPDIFPASLIYIHSELEHNVQQCSGPFEKAQSRYSDYVTG